MPPNASARLLTLPTVPLRTKAQWRAYRRALNAALAYVPARAETLTRSVRMYLTSLPEDARLCAKDSRAVLHAVRDLTLWCEGYEAAREEA